MAAAERVIVILVVTGALLFGATATATASPAPTRSAVQVAQVAPLPTVEIGWTWWLMSGWAKFNADETRVMAQMGVVAAVSYASSKIPSLIGKAAAAALGVALWATAQTAFHSGRCVTIVFGAFVRRVYAGSC